MLISPLNTNSIIPIYASPRAAVITPAVPAEIAPPAPIEDDSNAVIILLFTAKPNITVIEAIIPTVANACNGVPRRINQLCNQCLLIGNNQNKNMIDIDVVMDAADETEVI